MGTKLADICVASFIAILDFLVIVLDIELFYIAHQSFVQGNIIGFILGITTGSIFAIAAILVVILVIQILRNKL